MFLLDSNEHTPLQVTFVQEDRPVIKVNIDRKLLICHRTIVYTM